MANKNFRVKHGLEVAGSATIDNDLTVTGNLTVNGDTTTLNTATLSVEDNVVILNSNVTGTPSTNAGIEVERGDSTNTLLRWNESTDKWQFTNDGSTYYDMVTANTTYTQNASSTTGGANLNLVGSDSTTDSIKLSGGTGVTVSRLDADTVDIGIGQAVGTGADVVFNSVDANITDGNYVVGQLIATRNTSYTPPTSALTTVTGSNGIVISSSTGGANGYSANLGIRYHTGDTTAGGFNAPTVAFSTAAGTSSAPAGAVANLIAGGLNYDGYTAGTSNNYASQIATTNQGAGTGAITPLQAQGYIRQNFTNSTTVTTAVTGASGTGSVATLTFTTQNTAPYVVGQTITVAGMTPSGYNGTYVLTAATTSSISYANATTGFTTGGTIGAANTVTAAGMGFRVRGFANSTVLSAANRFNFMDLTASSATFKSNTYTFADEVITGSTLTAKNYMTLGATTGSINQDTFTLKNTAGTTTYGTFTSTGTTITGAGLHTFTRTTTGTPGSAESRPALNIQLSRTDQATPNDFDSTSFRTRVAGSNGTFYTISDINSVYKTGGDVQFNINLANGDQTTGSFSGLNVYSGSITKTTIRAGTASGTAGGSSVNDIMVLDNNKILNNRPHRSATTTATIARGSTYTPAVGVNNFIELELTAGTDPTYIDVDNLTVAGEGGHQAILVYNNSGSSVGNGDLVIRNNGTQINATQDTIASGARVTVYCVGNYASCEYMTAA
jgi:hypothetical protein